MIKKSLTLIIALLCVSAAHALDVQGHRGTRWTRPENTLAAFREAMNLGVDTLEMDLNVTSDNVAVVTHNTTLNPDICLDPEGRKITKSIPIRSLTLAELRRYDCGTLKNPKFAEQVPVAGEKIPTLEEVFNMVRTERPDLINSIRFNIETKMDEAHPADSPTPQEFAAIVAPVLNASGFAERITIQSFDWRTLPEMKRLSPRIKLSLLIGKGNLMAFLKLPCAVDIVSPPYQLVTGHMVNSYHKKGIAVLPWTVNSEHAWARMVKLGVDGIITDNPGGLIQFLKQSQQH